MARKSTIKTLPKEVQAAVVQALEDGATIDQIVKHLGEVGHPRSRSAVGRYAKDYAELASRQRDIRVVAKAFADDFGGAENAEGKLMVQMLTSIGARMILPIASGESDDLDAGEFHAMAKATRELMSAAKLDADRDAKVREQTKRDAADAAEKAARKSGASADTINLVKSAILGLSA